MITKTDLDAIKLSPTKKDYYQIWNELLDTAKKLSERWDPTSTNESDPGIVLLKVLTAIADKLNYNIDKNILEAFMPSAAQEESMRKLCDMMGYNIKYYQSAEVPVTITFLGGKDKPELPEDGLTIPQFTAIYNADQDINFVTLKPLTLTADSPSGAVDCIEGQIVQCETDDDNIISMTQIDDRFRYYLPETQIAENGIFIYNITDGILSSPWKKVENLNTEKPNSHVYKFGFDSKEGRPYIQLPEDLAQIIEDGLLIYYIRTSGINGNIKARVLSAFELPTTDSWEEGGFTADQFSIINTEAAINGANIESITQAYDNFKKTVGTFDTLVTCRDYMNKIYQLTEENGTPLVSNIIVSDIRNDINRSQTLCSFNDYGICYIEQSKISIDDKTPLISNFDLVLYPFKTVHGLNNYKEFVDSFTYTSENVPEIKDALEDYKTISHIFTLPNTDDLACIKVYLKINAKITTTYKVNIAEESLILANIKSAIYENFNCRKLDFGEEIPFESIVECISNADARIKNVTVDDPDLYVKYVTADNVESDITTIKGKKLYNKLALKNILAGRIPLFNYKTDFSYDFTETTYSELNPTYPATPTRHISRIYPKCEIPITASKGEIIQLGKNEFIRFRAPNLKTVLTYPSYVNYFIKLNSTTGKQARPANFKTLEMFMNEPASGTDQTQNTRWQALADFVGNNFRNIFTSIDLGTVAESERERTFNTLKTRYGAMFEIESNEQLVKVDTYSSSNLIYYYFEIKLETFLAPLNNFIITQKLYWYDNYDTPYANKITNCVGIYRSLGTSPKHVKGHLVDKNFVKYQLCSVFPAVDPQTAITHLYIQSAGTQDDINYLDGLGRDGVLSGIQKDEQYTLGVGEYLLINYTQSNTADDATSTQSSDLIKNEYYGPGTTIRPNFSLNDSTNVAASGIAWTKTTGYDFKNTELGQDPAGMYTLGTNEQIEIRELAKVKLAENPTYLYWILKDPNKEITSAKPYTLEDGEYIFYTDANKLDLAYYGAGTEITITNAAASTSPVSIKNFESGSEISAEDILENGIEAIPWRVFNLSDSNYIELTEYQYINITDGDKVEIGTSDISWPVGAELKLTNNWYNCVNNNSIKYYINGVGSKLPAINIKIYNGNDIRELGWAVSSRLNLNVGPNITQILSSYDSLTIKYSEIEGGSYIETIKPITKDKPVAIKTNWTCQVATSELITEIFDDEGQNISTSTIKVFKESPIGIQNEDEPLEPLIEHNINNTWTSISAKSMKKDTDYATLNINIPKTPGLSYTDNFGLLMIYLSNSAQTDDSQAEFKKNAYLEVSAGSPVIFNYYKEADKPSDPSEAQPTSWSWWENGKVENKYYLRKGINIIMFKESCNIKFYPDKEHHNNVLLLGDLDIVRCTTTNPFGFNTGLLDYQKTFTDASITAERELAFDLYTADEENQFYYNCLIDSSSSIDLNTALIGTEDEELLSSPDTWYDYNNINNNFVISEIDADYLDKGIRLTKASKLY